MNKKGDGNTFWVIISIVIALIVLVVILLGPGKILNTLFKDVGSKSDIIGNELNRTNLSGLSKPSSIQGSLIKIEQVSTYIADKATESFIYPKL
ncbi:MAG TPA: hypothetical protein VJB94_03065 [Candidatus Nanoarchaeia archaeon]|nr:hypothetical protein [Candidatus Nanoarchaeia archaeon]